jgi:hypothetical protein
LHDGGARTQVRQDRDRDRTFLWRSVHARRYSVAHFLLDEKGIPNFEAMRGRALRRRAEPVCYFDLLFVKRRDLRRYRTFPMMIMASTTSNSLMKLKSIELRTTNSASL